MEWGSFKFILLNLTFLFTMSGEENKAKQNYHSLYWLFYYCFL